MSKYIKYLGIDWGKKRIGLSVGDSETKIAIPFRVVNNLEELLDIIKKEEIDELVVGLPISLSGQVDKVLPEFKLFLKKLKQIRLPLHLVDERLSSREADARIGKQKQGASRDAVAAMIILESYLSRNHESGR